MKKHLFTLIALVAMVLIGGSAMAQGGTGLVPSDPIEIAIGATSTFTVTPDNVANTLSWDVYEVATAGLTASTTLATSVKATKATIASPAAASSAITFYAAPAAASVFVVEFIELETATGACSTRRRFYVSIFDFDVEVIALGTSSVIPADWTTPAAQATCNSWSDLVVANSTATPLIAVLDGAQITTEHADNVNVDGGQVKLTETYFAVKITLQGATLNNFLWRFQYSMPAATGMNIYEISAETAGATFAGVAGDANWIATNTTSLTTPTAYAAGTYTNEQTVYVEKTVGLDASATYLFKVTTHNMLGAADMVYDLRIDKVQMEKGDLTSPTAYNNGQKLNVANIVAGAAQLDGTRDIALTTTVRQSPATSIIGITE